MNRMLIIAIAAIVIIGLAVFILASSFNTSPITIPITDNGASSDAASVGQIPDQNYLSVEAIPPSP